MRRVAYAAGGILPVHGATDVSFSPPGEDSRFSLIIAPPRETAPASRQAGARAKRLLALEIDFIFDDDFAASENIEAVDSRRPPAGDLGTSPAKSVSSGAGQAKPNGSAAPGEGRWLSAPEEIALFRRMNYLKYRAHVLRTLLDSRCPCEALMCEIQRLLDDACSIRNHLMCAFIRLVGSIARRFIDPQHSYDELVSEGCLPLLRAIAKFDFRRGYRFSTYATHAIQRHFFRLFSKSSKERARYRESAVEKLEGGIDRRRRPSRNEAQMLAAEASIDRLIGRLDRREQDIVQSRYGLKRGEDAQTLKAIGERLGVCKERVRQLEQRAIGKLRVMAEEAEFEAPAL